MNIIQIHPEDNVAVALHPVHIGEAVTAGTVTVTAQEEIPGGHKIAMKPISRGDSVVKYGNPIAVATSDIEPGAWVHTHNARTGLSEGGEYHYEHKTYTLPKVSEKTFQGYRRKDGSVGIRNEIWVLPIVGCINGIAKTLVEKNQYLVNGTVEGLYEFSHPFGCSQLGDDLAMTRRVLADLVRHPNAGGVLCIGLGCENLTMDQFLDELGPYDEDRVKFMLCQQVDDELETGSKLLEQLAAYAGQFHRETVPASELVIGLKCGGSDGLSGITANPVVGRFSDRLIAAGGTTVLTEVPEMFGAENILFSRCESEEVFQEAVRMVNDFKTYFVAHGQVVYENPSPGNKEGGITTLEDKSCGCVQKGGSAQVVDVLDYAMPVKKKGLNLLSGPGNDLVSATNLTASGSHMVLFTTGRGTPFGAPAPTVKLSTNTPLFEKKRDWIDFNTGTVADGTETLDEAADRLFEYVLDVASGRKTNTERRGYREISIFKDGVVL